MKTMIKLRENDIEHAIAGEYQGINHYLLLNVRDHEKIIIKVFLDPSARI